MKPYLLFLIIPFLFAMIEISSPRAEDEEKEAPRAGGPCEYHRYEGRAEITSLRKAVDPYKQGKESWEAKFRFIRTRKLRNPLLRWRTENFCWRSASLPFSVKSSSSGMVFKSAGPLTVISLRSPEEPAHRSCSSFRLSPLNEDGRGGSSGVAIGSFRFRAIGSDLRADCQGRWTMRRILWILMLFFLHNPLWKCLGSGNHAP